MTTIILKKGRSKISDHVGALNAMGFQTTKQSAYVYLDTKQEIGLEQFAGSPLLDYCTEHGLGIKAKKLTVKGNKYYYRVSVF